MTGLLLANVIFLASLTDDTISITPQNASVTFEVDSTWHTVHGYVHNFIGTLRFGTAGDFSTANVEIEMPVGELDTDNSRRDSRMREVMHQASYPVIRFKSGALEGNCDLKTLEAGKSCRDELAGHLNISGTEQKVLLDVDISKDAQMFHFKAKTEIDWSNFGIEDPSILVAKLDKRVTIHVTLDLPENP